ncbi:MAG: hypothetical protein KGM42_08515 [Hyphomicrobiales bacterium]|nr:hypothetical protein [Hyphomicrobiales bacterium]
MARFSFAAAACVSAAAILLSVSARVVDAAPHASSGANQARRAHAQSTHALSTHARSTRARSAVAQTASPEPVAASARPSAAFDPAAPAAVTLLADEGREGTLRAATDIADTLDDAGGLRVLPVVGHDASHNVSDLLRLDSIDLVLAPADALAALRANAQSGGAERSIVYVAHLFDSPMHVLARSDVTDVRQLAGRKVGVGAPDTTARFSAERIFARLGVSIEPTRDEQGEAVEKLRKGEIAAVVFFGAGPAPWIAHLSNQDRQLHFLAAPWTDAFGEGYEPATLQGADYPDLMHAGETIDTIGVAQMLVAAQPKPGDPRAMRLARFVDAFFSKIGDLQASDRLAAWRNVNLAANAPGWTRLQQAQDWLDGKRGDDLRRAYAATSDTLEPSAPAIAAPAPPIAPTAAEFERFKRFVAKKRGKSGEKLAKDDTVLMFRQYQQWSGAR